MKRMFLIKFVLISFFIFLVSFFSVLASENVKTLDVENNFEPDASKILYDYVMENMDNSSKERAEITSGRTHACKIDLNNDGVEEIIGVVLSPYYCTSENCSLFILQKQDNKFNNIVSNIMFRGKIKVKRHLTNGYRDIELFVPDLKSGLQYKDGKYDWNYHLKDLAEKVYSYKTLDFSIERNVNSGRVLYDFILKEAGIPEKDFLKLSPTIKPEAAIAYEVDLNDDGNNEIIGFFNSTYNMGTYGNHLYILQKQGDEYVDIAGALNLEPQFNIFILEHKSNGFRDIKFTGSVGNAFRSFVVRFNSENYEI